MKPQKYVTKERKVKEVIVKIMNSNKEREFQKDFELLVECRAD